MVISHHIFLFAFKWETYTGVGHNQKTLDERANLSQIYKCIDPNYWEEFNFEHKTEDEFNTYNEYAYFYDFARDVLHLDNQKHLVSGKQYGYLNLDNQRGINSSSEYQITIKNRGVYSLKIRNILLNLYEHGVGILSFHLDNYYYDKKEDVFLINDFGRRFYPQFLGGDFPLTDTPKGSFLADSITLTGIVSYLGTSIKEDFNYYNIHDALNNQAFVLPQYFQCLLGEKFVTKPTKKDDCIITPLLDDRMFVMSFLISSDFLSQLKIEKTSNSENEYNYNQSTDWYQYLFVDGKSASCDSKPMHRSLLKEHTYDRWITNRYYNAKSKSFENTGQLFGISRYSFVVLVDDAYFPKYIVGAHFRHMYFQMVLLCLLQRAYLFSFSGEVARIAEKLKNQNVNSDTTGKEISRLYLQYIKFVNGVYFREITPQEQGIELYDLLQKHMRISEDVKSLGTEVGELNTYIQSIQESRLSKVAGIYLPITLLAGILGINTFNLDSKIEWATNLREINLKTTTLMIATFALILWSIIISIRHFNSKKTL